MADKRRAHGALDGERTKVLAHFEKKHTNTIEDIAALGVRAKYIYKIIFQLRMLGYEFESNRDGRKVVSYTFCGKRKPREFRVAEAA